jgi:hypothetical protein
MLENLKNKKMNYCTKDKISEMFQLPGDEGDNGVPRDFFYDSIRSQRDKIAKTNCLIQVVDSDCLTKLCRVGSLCVVAGANSEKLELTIHVSHAKQLVGRTQLLDKFSAVTDEETRTILVVRIEEVVDGATGMVHGVLGKGET